jgi:putative spermidine/putrescine transport system permease protein
VLFDPRYLRSLLATVALSVAVTFAALVISGCTGFFLQRQRFPGRTLLIALLSFPLAFPGVVVGFLVILLAGRQGLLGTLTEYLSGERLVFAYGMGGLFLGYLYFSIPRTILTVMANVEKLDPSLEEAARTLGASPFQVLTDVILPALMPALIAAGAICFATSMGAFGTAFTLATQIDVLPITIYNEFTNYANFSVAAVLSLLLGLVTWLALAVARQLTGAQAAAAA